MSVDDVTTMDRPNQEHHQPASGRRRRLVVAAAAAAAVSACAPSPAPATPTTSTATTTGSPVPSATGPVITAFQIIDDVSCTGAQASVPVSWATRDARSV